MGVSPRSSSARSGSGMVLCRLSRLKLARPAVARLEQGRGDGRRRGLEADAGEDDLPVRLVGGDRARRRAASRRRARRRRRRAPRPGVPRDAGTRIRSPKVTSVTSGSAGEGEDAVEVGHRRDADRAARPADEADAVGQQLAQPVAGDGHGVRAADLHEGEAGARLGAQLGGEPAEVVSAVARSAARLAPSPAALRRPARRARRRRRSRAELVGLLRLRLVDDADREAGVHEHVVADGGVGHEHDAALLLEALGGDGRARAVEGGDAHGKGEAHGGGPVARSVGTGCGRAAVSELPAALQHSIARDRRLPQRDAAVVDGHEAGGEHVEAGASSAARTSSASSRFWKTPPASATAPGPPASRTRRQRSSTTPATVACSRAPTAPGAAPASRSSSTPSSSGARRTTAGAGPSGRGRGSAAAPPAHPAAPRRGPRRRRAGVAVERPGVAASAAPAATPSSPARSPPGPRR